MTRRTASLALTIGLVLLIALIAGHGAREIGALLATAGSGLLLVCLAHLPPVFANALAWRALLQGEGIPSGAVHLFWLRWLADSINSLLPVAQVGGEVVRVQHLSRTAVPGPVAGASVVVDLTLGLVTLIGFILLGIGLSVAETGTGETGPLLVGATVFLAFLALFYWVQRSGWLIRLASVIERQAGGSTLQAVTGGVQALDQALDRLYRRRGPLWRCAGWRFVGWVLGAAEVWVALAVLGHPVDPYHVLILESLGQAFRNAGFAIPGALGVQEGGLVIAGGLIGLPPEVAIAVALSKRCRDLMLGIPVLLVWRTLEARAPALPDQSASRAE